MSDRGRSGSASSNGEPIATHPAVLTTGDELKMMAE
jgi:hypothetical protein